MDIKPIRSDADRDDALHEIKRLWGAERGMTEGDKLGGLVIPAGAYGDQQNPVLDARPVEVLRDAVTDMGRSQAALAELV